MNIPTGGTLQPAPGASMASQTVRGQNVPQVQQRDPSVQLNIDIPTGRALQLAPGASMASQTLRGQNVPQVQQ